MDHNPATSTLTSAGVLSPQPGGPSPLGLTRADDPADAFFRADAKRMGISLTEYEHRFNVGIRKGPREGRLEYNEVPVGTTSEDFDIAAFAERKTTPERLHKRRHGRR